MLLLCCIIVVILIVTIFVIVAIADSVVAAKKVWYINIRKTILPKTKKICKQKKNTKQLDKRGRGREGDG